jgi:Flp pilus assembly pilin Flp
MDRLIGFLFEEEGVTSVEYALIAGLVVMGIVLALAPLRDALVTSYNSVASAFGSSL